MRPDRVPVENREALIAWQERIIRSARAQALAAARRRAIAIAEWHESGTSFEEIGARLGRSPRRIQQLVAMGRKARAEGGNP